MAVKSGFYDSQNHDRLYSAEDFNEAYSLIIADGIDNSFGGKLEVSVDSGLTLNVASGKAYYIGKWVHNDAIYQVTLEEASALLPRIDAIVIDVNDTDEVRDTDIIVVSGTPASTPVRPTLVNETNHIQVPLAYVNVAAGATSLSSSDLTDVRGSGISTWTGAGIPKNNIALIENGTTASQTLTKGAYIVHNNQFYIVTQTIAQGTAIIEGVNIESRTVGEEITAINSNLSQTLKGSLGSFTFNYSSASIAPNGSKAFAPTNSIPSNTWDLGTIVISSGNPNAVVYKFTNTGEVDIHNLTSSTITLAPSMIVRTFTPLQ